MKTYTIKIRSSEDEQFVIDILNALESKHLIDLLPLGYLGIKGEIVNEDDLRESVFSAENSRPFSLADAKKYLDI
ncbi:MAG: hypothetical protein R2822_24630 [Spirosomataceae bacterium]